MTFVNPGKNFLCDEIILLFHYHNKMTENRNDYLNIIGCTGDLFLTNMHFIMISIQTFFVTS